MELIKLNFPEYKFTVKAAQSGTQSVKIFDIVRKKYVILSPEEWVRQHLIHYLLYDRKFPMSLTSVEKTVMVNRLAKRFDILVYSMSHTPLLLVECKSPDVNISQHTFDQAARYNMTLGAPYFVLSNGLYTFCCKINVKDEKYDFIEEIPFYKNLLAPV